MCYMPRNHSGRSWEGERAVREERLQHCQQRSTRFVPGRKCAPDAVERHGPSWTAEGAGDFLLDLEHPQISFGLVVIEGRGEFVQKREHFVLMLEEPVEQIARRALLASARLGGTRRGWGSGLASTPSQSGSW